jgi:parallel beta-helix repeat protein
MNRTAWLIVCIVATLIAARCVSARDIYVNNNPPDSKPDGTKDHPFDTIQKAIVKAVDRDNIFIRPGTYGPAGGSATLDVGNKKIAIRSRGSDEGVAIAETIIEGQGFKITGHQGRETQIRGLTIRRSPGIYVESSHPTILQCVFEYDQRAITCVSSNARIQTCVFVGNTVPGSESGGAIQCSGGTEILHCTFTGNGAAKGGAIGVVGGSPIIRNCVLWGNASLGSGDSQIFVATGATPSILYCDVQDGTSQGWFGTGNIDVDPLLTAGGFLRKDSPCVDKGTADLPAPPTPTDIQGETRPIGAGPDMGADEWNDTDADGLPDFWQKKYFGGPAAADPAADADNDDLPNLKEYEAFTDPKVADGDNDHWNDGREVACGANPRYPNWYVDDAKGDDNFDGRAPEREGVTSHGPKQTIRPTVEKAKSGETVIIAPGIYSGGANYYPYSSQVLVSGERVITIQSQNPFDPNVVAATVIDPNRKGRAFYFHGVHSPLSCVQGLTLRNGFADCGGAILLDASSPTIAHCTITGNLGIADGGGLHGGNDLSGMVSTPTIVDCVISRNETRGNGGGLAFCAGQVIGCSIAENRAGIGGGGICSGRAPILVTNCTIERNTALQGGGMSAGGSFPVPERPPILKNCIFSGNHGGGMYYGAIDPVLENCIFTGNNGGGMFGDTANPTLRNCTFSGNRLLGGLLGGDKGAGMLLWTGCSPTLTNCIFWGNGTGGSEGEQIASVSSSPQVINYSCVQGWSGSLPGVGNIRDDPLFADPGHWDPNGTQDDPNDDFSVDGDYHLKSKGGRWDAKKGWVQDSVTSPCIDAGDPASPVGDEPKPNGDRINMGAYGGTVEASRRL